ncbi:hypothetical protein Pint_07071 [Pistacia integerrima]|uniref:Uncharacterized protein n=1 Tax=Pistacia integerrima TaxID=434235 RepID=A0ACC0XWC1_9ROSI|nr:hypothetical protein Pint_07071 [Pistacia integerrima]
MAFSRKGFLGVALVASVTGLTSAFSPTYITLIVMPRLNWRWPLALSSLPSFAALLLHGLVPQSPRYLCMAGQTADAHRALEKVAPKNGKKLPSGMLLPDNIARLDNEFSVPEHNPLLSSSANKTTQFKSGFSPIYSLFSSRLIRTTFLPWVLFFEETFLYYGVILLTSELCVEQSACGSALSLQNARNAGLYIEVFITSLAGNACVISASCVYPTSVRATGSGIANGVGIVGGMICPLVAVALVTGCHQTAAVILLEVLTVLLIVCVLLLPFETKGRELADTV